MSDTPRTDREASLGVGPRAVASGQAVHANFARQLERELSAWRPINTAPKDGTKVLLYVPSSHGWGGVKIGGWDEDKHAKYPKPFFNYTPYRISDSRGNPPSHWMPLPDAPPKEAPEA